MESIPRWSGRRHRTSFTNKQLELLRKAYECNKYPAPSKYTQLGEDCGLGASVVKTWFCNTRASQRKQLKPVLQMDDQDKDFYNYLIRNQPQILPFYRMIPWQQKNPPATHQGLESNTCPRNLPKETKASQSCLLPSTSLNRNVVEPSIGSLSEQTQQPVPPTPSQFTVVQHQQFGDGKVPQPFKRSTGGAYHALRDAVRIDRPDTQHYMLSAKPGNLPLQSNGSGHIANQTRVQSFQEQRMMTPYINDSVYLPHSYAAHSKDMWIAHGQPTVFYTPVSNYDRFSNDSHEPSRKNWSQFPVDHRNRATNGQNGMSDPRWSQAMQHLNNQGELYTAHRN